MSTGGRDWDIEDFNPRPPRGGRLLPDQIRMEVSEISIHAPREGGDSTIDQNIVLP